MAGVVLLIASLAYCLRYREQAPPQRLRLSQAPTPFTYPHLSSPPSLHVTIERRDELLRLASLALDNANPAKRSEAAFELGEIDDPVARQVLEQVLYDPSRAVRRAAIDALSLNPDLDSIDILTRALSHPDPAVQDLADQSLAVLRGGS